MAMTTRMMVLLISFELFANILVQMKTPGTMAGRRHKFLSLLVAVAKQVQHHQEQIDKVQIQG
ncbi:MAG: hypothetical protein OSB58_05115, partial [Alphaproteobacteria bacterium]|nr:hypothetical protein [Alphaproteobacteria bacterium]